MIKLQLLSYHITTSMMTTITLQSDLNTFRRGWPSFPEADIAKPTATQQTITPASGVMNN